jgi:S-adenosylmethionine synthetase
MAEAGRQAQVTMEYSPKGRCSLRRCCRVHPAQPQHRSGSAARGGNRGGHLSVIPERLMDKNTKLYINPHRALRCGRPAGRLRAYRTARLLSIPTAAWAARRRLFFPARTRPRLTGRLLIWRDTRLKTLLRRGLAKRCEIELAYAIGLPIPYPCLWTPSGGGMRDERLSALVGNASISVPYSIIEKLDLRRRFTSSLRPTAFRQTRAGPPVGKDDMAQLLKAKA